MTPTQLSNSLGLHKSTVHRLVSVLEAHGYVERDPRSGRYELGFRLFELGSKAAARSNVLERAKPFLERLVAETGETAHLGILRQGFVVSLAKAESPRTFRTPATVGKHTPAHCTSLGKAVLAFATDAEIDDFIRMHGLRGFTRNTIVDAQKFKRTLHRARKNGYAVDNEEYEDGLKCVGAPVRDHSGQVIAALGVTGPATRLGKGRIPLLISSVIRAAGDLSASLNYK